jgi:hypothetical protein
MATLTPEHRKKMQEGRARKAAERAAALVAAAPEDEATKPANLPPLNDIEPIPFAEPDEPSPIEAAAVRRRLLLQGIPDDIAELISDEELEVIEAEEQKKAAAERKKRALADVRESLRQRARVENDLIPMSVLRDEAEQRRMDEPVTFRINVPRNGSGDPARSPRGPRVNGERFQQGMVYTRPRHVFESLRSMHYQTWLHELRFRTLPEDGETMDKGNVMEPARLRFAEAPIPFEITEH